MKEFLKMEVGKMDFESLQKSLDQNFKFIKEELKNIKTEIEKIDNKLSITNDNTIKNMTEIDHIFKEQEEIKKEYKDQVDILWNHVRSFEKSCKADRESCQIFLDKKINEKIEAGNQKIKLWIYGLIVSQLLSILGFFIKEYFVK